LLQSLSILHLYPIQSPGNIDTMKLFTMNKLYSVLQKCIYLLLLSSPVISEAQNKIESTNRLQKEESFYEIKTVPIP